MRLLILGIIGTALSIALSSAANAQQRCKVVQPNDVNDYDYTAVHAEDFYSSAFQEGNYRLKTAALDPESSGVYSRRTNKFYYFPLYPIATFDPGLLGVHVDPVEALKEIGRAHGKYVFVVIPSKLEQQFTEDMKTMNEAKLRNRLNYMAENLHGTYEKMAKSSFVRTSAIRQFDLDESKDYYAFHYQCWDRKK